MLSLVSRLGMAAACLAWTAHAAMADPARSAADQKRARMLLDNSPYSAGLLMARAVHAGLVRPAAAASPDRHTPVLKCSPAPCTLKNVQASEGSQPVNETPISIDPTHPS